MEQLKITEEHLEIAREIGACVRGLKRYRPGMDIGEVWFKDLEWVAKVMFSTLNGVWLPLYGHSGFVYGDGYGYWYGDGDGLGYGYGFGYWYGDGYGCGYGDGYGCGYGDGYGRGYGRGDGGGKSMEEIS